MFFSFISFFNFFFFTQHTIKYVADIKKKYCYKICNEYNFSTRHYYHIIEKTVKIGLEYNNGGSTKQQLHKA